MIIWIGPGISTWSAPPGPTRSMRTSMKVPFRDRPAFQRRRLLPMRVICPGPA